ncbi:MAG TPA: hypothetical protein VES88_01480 [Gemmatimonadaceae bacterium]|nr:hypothetical protein [Gemmatimonadaceae bacterium]
MNGTIRARRWVAYAFALFAVSGSIACNGSESAGPTGISGTYTLQTVNNASLPFTTSQDATYKAEILSWVITLNQDKTYIGSFKGRSTDNGTTTVNTVPTAGTYTVTGSAVRLLDPDGYLDATVVGSSLTIVIDGGAGVFTLRFTR